MKTRLTVLSSMGAAMLWVNFLAGCGATEAAARPDRRAAAKASQPANQRPPEDAVTQQMERFTLEGYGSNGSKRWQLEGAKARTDGDIVTILKPWATGFDVQRTAWLQSTIGYLNQANRRVRLEDDVRMHTSDGVWLFSQAMYWLPDRDEFLTDEPVRIESDHMLLRGRSAIGHSELKHAQILHDIELILNPTADEKPGDIHHVKITCDGPLSFDYDKDVATFEHNVHVNDIQGDMYSDKLIAYMDKNTHTISYAEATGDVRIVQQAHTATGGRAVYEPGKGRMTLLDSPSLVIQLDGSQGFPAPSFTHQAGNADRDQ